MKAITLTVNGERVDGSVEPRTHLADFLRGHVGLTGTHLGCEQGVCGACTVMIDGRPARSCIAYAAACDGAEVYTVEGFDDDPAMERLREAFSDHHGLQCGFCTPGMLITARDIVGRLESPDTTRIRHELSGNLCRCTGYQGIVNAIDSVIATYGRQPWDAAAGAGPADAGDGAPAPARTPPPTFERAATGGEAAGSREGASGAASAAPTMTVDAEGWTVVEQSFEVAHPVADVWAALEDVRSVAACMPGAEITEVDGARIEGRMRIRFGPISAAFAGTATRELDAQARTGTLSGTGTDSSSGTRAQGAVTYALRALDAGRTAVDISLRFKLSGSLAQFSRSGLVKDFAGRLTDSFATNLSRQLSGEVVDASATGGELNAISLVASVLWRRLRRLFGR